MNQIFVSAGQIARPNLATPTSCLTDGQFAQSVPTVKNDTQPRKLAENLGVAAHQAPNRKKSQPHLRRTVEQVREKWDFGDYSPSGYLVEIFSAMKVEGYAIVIRNVQAFCDEWGLSRRTFFRAKALLVSRGRLDEEIQGTLIVRLIPTNLEHLYDDKVGTDGARSGTHDDKVGTDGARSGTHDDKVGTTTPSNDRQDNQFDDSPDLYSDLNQILIRSLSQPTHPPERDLDNFSEDNKEGFREWLLQKANQLPKKPTFLNQWIESQAKKTENWQEYLKYREAQIEKINFPPAPREMPATLADFVYPLAQFSEADQRANILARLQVKWRMDGNARSSAIAEAEQQGFVITPIGIEEA